MHFGNVYQTNRLWLWDNIKLSLKKTAKIKVTVIPNQKFARWISLWKRFC
jgi:hypothetical protein